MSKLSVLQRKARELLQRGEWNAALHELQRIAALEPNNPGVPNSIGDVYLRKGDIATACEHFENAIRLYAALGLHNNAVALCRKVMRLGPARLEVRFHLARLRMEQGLRAEGAAVFEEYLEHCKPSGEALQKFETRCQEIVEAFPDVAPVGKILEKLEGLGAYVSAFKMVQRLAQRAADSGQEASARRYTEKMRTLRVLVENSGGLDSIMDAPAPEAASAADTSSAATVVDPSLAAGIVPGLDAVLAAGSEDFGPETPLEVLVPDPTVVNVDAPPDTAAPDLEIPDAPALSDLLQASIDVPADAEAGTDADADAASAEYELPETSFTDIAELFRDALPAAHAAPAPVPPPRTAATPDAAPQAPPPRRPSPAAPAANEPPPAWPHVETGGEMVEYQLGSHPESPRNPVWIPDTFTGDAAAGSTSGQTHDLEEVIDTFRVQMARALGDDGPARYDLGVAYFEMGLYNEALAEFEAAATHPSTRVRSLEMMAICLGRQGRHAEVVQLLQSVLRDANGSGALGLRYNLGLAYQALGRNDEARAQFQSVAQVDRGFRDVLTRLQSP